MATLSFDYHQEKIEKLDELAKSEGRNRSAYIQKVLLEYLQKHYDKNIHSAKKKKIIIKKK